MSKVGPLKLLRNILSLVCGLLSAIITFLICVYACGILHRLTGERFGRLWIGLGVAAGIILGIWVSGIVKNLIYREPTRF